MTVSNFLPGREGLIRRGWCVRVWCDALPRMPPPKISLSPALAGLSNRAPPSSRTVALRRPVRPLPYATHFLLFRLAAGGHLKPDVAFGISHVRQKQDGFGFFVQVPRVRARACPAGQARLRLS